MSARLRQPPARRNRTLVSRVAAVFALFILVVSARPVAAEKVEQLSPQGYVNDFAAVIDADSRQKLAALCQEVDQKANAQIAVVTMHSLEGDTAQNFANRLFAKWGVGPKGKNRGVLILVAVSDHQYWTEVGYGLEPILPDGKIGGFWREVLPVLRQGQYAAALMQVTSRIAAVIAQDAGVTLSQGIPASAMPAPPPDDRPVSFHGIPPGLILPLILLAFFIGWRALVFLLVLAGIMRRPRGGYGGRGYGGGWWIGPMGGGSGGWGGGGGGFGGFGGGSSGGGGAGGSW